MKKIVVVTGIRSEYDLLFPVLKKINKSAELDLSLVVSGAHLSHNFGYTIKEIEKDGFKIGAKVENLLNTNSFMGKAKSSGILLSGLAQALSRLNPDIVMALGDREEPLIAAITSNYMNIPFVHIAGGDRTFPKKGDVDEVVRHATTKLAHLHFTMAQEHTDRIIKLGEEPWRVFTVGNPGLDRLKNVPHISKRNLSNRINFDISKGPILLVTQHVINMEAKEASKQIRITMEALKELGYKALVSYPNSDVGSMQIIDVINEYNNQLDFIKTYKNLSRLEFVNLLRNIDVLLGNSSMGILEAPFLKLPAINIGERQKERLHAENVIFVEHNKEQIVEAVQKAIHNEDFKEKVNKCRSPYGNGNSSEKIVNILSDIKINDKLFAKDITY